MAKNTYASKLQQQKKADFNDAVSQGFQMGMQIAEIALNHRFGFAGKRLLDFETEVKSLFSDMAAVGDTEVIQSRLYREINRIKGNEVGYTAHGGKA